MPVFLYNIVVLHSSSILAKSFENLSNEVVKKLRQPQNWAKKNFLIENKQRTASAVDLFANIALVTFRAEKVMYWRTSLCSL